MGDLMRITVSSIFRNSTSYLPRYFTQIDELRRLVDVRLVLGEGDSNDGTGDVIRALVDPDSDDTVVTINHGGPNYGSIDIPIRWEQIAKVVSGVIDEVGDPYDAFVWVESDLLWDPRTMLDLLLSARCVAPLVLAGDTTRFYDTWGFRQDGKQFNAQFPYQPDYGKHEGQYEPIDSCGSCFIVPDMYWDVVRRWDGHWPFPAGGKLWLDREAIVRHP